LTARARIPRALETAERELPASPSAALDYRVSGDGSIRESAFAGGIDYYALPAGTRAFLFVDLNWQAKRIAVVRTYIEERGWALNCQRFTAMWFATVRTPRTDTG
jgi:hypothetical protein